LSFTTPSGGPILGLFPWFGLEVVGGAEASGRLAWQTVRAAAQAQGQAAHLFTYGAPAGAIERTAERTATGRSRLAAILAALRCPAHPSIALVWHVGMLKLLPFLRRRPVRSVLMLHGIEVWRRHDPLTRSLLRKVDLLISNSEQTWLRFITFYPELAGRPWRTVQLGLGEPAMPAPAPAGPPRALIIGRMVRSEGYKGHHELIAAWPALVRTIPDAELWVVGEGDLRPALEAQAAALGLAQAVRFFGHVADHEKERLIARCHCLAMPSRGEGFGLVYLEAMRLARPCLVGTQDAGREVINPPEAGLAVDPTNQQALVAALSRLLSPGPEWEQWSAQARRRYEGQFTARHYQQRLLTALSLEAHLAGATNLAGVPQGAQ